MLSEASKKDQAVPAAVLFSAGLDSAVLLAHAAEHAPAIPVYVRTGLAWERDEIAIAERLLKSPPYRHARPLVSLAFDMRDVYPATHWAIRGEAPGFDTSDKDVYLEGRNLVLLTKVAVYMARERLTRVLLGPLACNPFPDATPEFFRALQEALSLGLDQPISIETPLASMHKADVIRLGTRLGVPMELTLSCMQPVEGLHCGRCSKCRERRDAFIETGIQDPTMYAVAPLR
jgi:7-cyano-7-deazaguanine synthase